MSGPTTGLERVRGAPAKVGGGGGVQRQYPTVETMTGTQCLTLSRLDMGQRHDLSHTHSRYFYSFRLRPERCVVRLRSNLILIGKYLIQNLWREAPSLTHVYVKFYGGKNHSSTEKYFGGRFWRKVNTF